MQEQQTKHAVTDWLHGSHCHWLTGREGPFQGAVFTGLHNSWKIYVARTSKI